MKLFIFICKLAGLSLMYLLSFIIHNFLVYVGWSDELSDGLSDGLIGDFMIGGFRY
jgi:hypothetical protein